MWERWMSKSGSKYFPSIQLDMLPEYWKPFGQTLRCKWIQDSSTRYQAHCSCHRWALHIHRWSICQEDYCNIPGTSSNIITVTDSSDLYVSPEYCERYSADYDYGLILLPGSGNCNDGFGWSACMDDKELTNRLMTICGYPADKSPHGSLWITGGEITKCTANTISYINDTIGGQNGSPVYTWYHGYWTVLGIHSYGGCPNSATRFTREMIFRFLEWIPDCLREKSLLSQNFPMCTSAVMAMELQNSHQVEVAQ